MDVLPLIQTKLVKVLRAERTIQAVILTDRTGLVLISVTKNQQSDSLIGMGALASALYLGTEAQGESSFGDLDLTASEFRDGKIFLKGCGTAIMVVLTKNLASIKKVRTAMKRISIEIEELLKGAEPVKSMVDDIKSISRVLDELNI